MNFKLILCVFKLEQNGKALEALEVYAGNQPIPTLDAGTLSTIRMIAIAVLALPNLSGVESYNHWAALRNIMLQMVFSYYYYFFLKIAPFDASITYANQNSHRAKIFTPPKSTQRSGRC